MQTVLLIENDLATLVARALVLRSFGYTVLEASSQEEALHTCQEHPGPIRLWIITTPGSFLFSCNSCVLGYVPSLSRTNQSVNWRTTNTWPASAPLFKSHSERIPWPKSSGSC
jgi:CheY-like chemotaxis protein